MSSKNTISIENALYIINKCQGFLVDCDDKFHYNVLPPGAKKIRFRFYYNPPLNDPFFCFSSWKEIINPKKLINE